ncbi:hypothetical protein [Streptomyces sp. NPDC060035]|uniref:hypothetical protein n=1 Tax=Streptomyces sp. NPDC060035 TaxID=3347044 RepID=UPI0036BB5DD5
MTTTHGTTVPELSGWLGEQLKPIGVVSVGATELPADWAALAPCTRTVAALDPLRKGPEGDSGAVLPVALSAYGGEEQINIARDPARSSLLEPNWPVVSRHGGMSGFEVVERRVVPSVSPAELAASHGPADALLLDCSGLEYQLLSAALPSLSNAICVEVTGGMVDNYVGQYPLPVVSTLLYGSGYSLADLTVTARPGAGEPGGGRLQPVEYHAVFLRDYTLRPEGFDFHQGIKLLVLCRQLGFLAFGRELAVTMHSRSVLPDAYARALRQEAAWREPWPVRPTGDA